MKSITKPYQKPFNLSLFYPKRRFLTIIDKKMQFWHSFPMFKIQKMDFLVSLYIFCVASSELMGGKTFHVLDIGSFSLNASAAIFIIPIIFSITDIITEVFGKERAQSVVRSGFFMILFLLIFSVLATSLPPSTRFLATENAYDTIFGTSARIAAASLIAFATSELLDVYIFYKIRQKLGEKALWFRNNVSNFISQFIDSFVFIFLAFYAFDKPIASNWVFLFSLILPYWFLRCFMSIIETPFVYLGVKWLKTSTDSK